MKRGKYYFVVYLTNGETVRLRSDGEDATRVGLWFYNECDDGTKDTVLSLAPGSWQLYYETDEYWAPMVEEWTSEPRPELKPAEFRFRERAQ